MAYSLPRADRWEGDENSCAMGFDAVEAFSRGPSDYVSMGEPYPGFFSGGDSSTLIVPQQSISSGTLRIETAHGGEGGFVYPNGGQNSLPFEQKGHYEERKDNYSNSSLNGGLEVFGVESGSQNPHPGATVPLREP